MSAPHAEAFDLVETERVELEDTELRESKHLPTIYVSKSPRFLQSLPNHLDTPPSTTYSTAIAHQPPTTITISWTVSVLAPL
jgi:hypothetical protein